MKVERYEYNSHTEFILSRESVWEDADVQRELKGYGIVYDGINVPIISYVIEGNSYVSFGRCEEGFSLIFSKNRGKYDPSFSSSQIEYLMRDLSRSLEICKYKEICVRSEYTDEQINDEYRTYLFICITSLGFEDIMDYHILTFDEYKERFLKGEEIRLPR